MPSISGTSGYQSQLHTPNGQLAGGTDRVMLLSEWSSVLQNDPINPRVIIAAGMGRPTFPVHPDLLSSVIEEAQRIRDVSVIARSYLDDDSVTPEQTRINVGKKRAVIGYDNPQGKLSARVEAAKALSKWYGVEIKPENILFTTGGAGALFDIFTMLNHQVPDGRIVTPLPHYSLYASINYGMNNLHPIEVMQEPGYKLTAEALAKSITEAKKKAEIDGKPISAFLFCDPNNPLGTVVSKEEWIKIAEVLKTVPDVPVIFDGAYAEMVFDLKNRSSLLEVADDELKKRIILLRSGTKALSVPGLRMAIAVSFDNEIITRLQQTNIDTSGHPATITQDAFAKMLHLLNEPRELAHFVNHYKPQVDLVYNQFNEMRAAMPDPLYKPEGTFYVVGDLSDLLGTELHPDAYKAVSEKKLIGNDEDLCYDLLFRNGIMIAPMSYYGLNGKKQAFMRITCSGGDKELNKLMGILAERLFVARIEKIDSLAKEINNLIEQLQATQAPQNKISLIQTQLEIILKIDFFPLDKNTKALKAKDALSFLKEIKNEAKELLLQHNQVLAQAQETKKLKVVHKLKSFHSTETTRKVIDGEWKKFVDKIYPRPSAKAARESLYHLSPADRVDTPSWKAHLHAAPNPIAEKCRVS